MASIQARVALFIYLLILLAVTFGCGTDTVLSTTGIQVISPEVTALPDPGELRQASSGQLVVDGSEFEDMWPHNRVQRVNTVARYSPQFTNGVSALADAAYAVYPFNVEGYTGDPVLHFYFAETGEQYCGWVGLPDFAKNRWDWVALPNPVAGHSQIEFALANRDQDGSMPVALVFLGQEAWDLSSIHLGFNTEPGDWPMAGHDELHSHCTSALGPTQGKLLWQFHSTGPALFPWCLATDSAGNVYISSGNSFIAYDEWGNYLWDCYDTTPNTLPAFGADGTVYVGGRWPDNGLHAILPNGQHYWVFETELPVLSHPVMTPDGNVVFGCDDGHLYCVRPNGSQEWELNLDARIQCGVGIAADGTIYVSYCDGAMTDPKEGLIAVSPAGEIIWDSPDNPGVGRGRIVVGPDGSFYMVTGKDQADLTSFNPDGSLRWQQSGCANPYTWPAISSDNVIYVGGTDPVKLTQGLNALSADGHQLWHVALGSDVQGAPQLFSDGRILCNTSNGIMALISSEGALEWEYLVSAGFWISPAAGDGACYGAGLDGTVYAVNIDGSARWQQGSGRPVYSSPVVASDGTIYFGCEDTFLYALWPDGTMKWRFGTGGGISASPLIAPDGTLYVGSKDGCIYAVTPGGLLKWTYQTENLVEGNPVQDASGNLYCGSNDYNLYSLTSAGELRWKFHTGWKVTGAPSIDADGNLYFGSWDHNVYCLDSAGNLVWLYNTEGPVKGSVGLSDDKVFVGCENDTMTGKIYSLEKDTGEVDWSYISGGPIQMGVGLGTGGYAYAASNMRESGDGGTIYAVADDRLKWSFAAPNLSQGLAVDGAEIVYAGTATGKVVALQKTTEGLVTVWQYLEHGANFYTPAIADGRIYIGYSLGLSAFGAE